MYCAGSARDERRGPRVHCVDRTRLCEAALDALDEHRPIHRLAQTRHRARIERAPAATGLVIRRDEHHRHENRGIVESLLDLEAGHFRHVHVEHDAIRAICAARRKELLPCREGSGFEARGAQQPTQCLAHRRVIVHDADQRRPDWIGRYRIGFNP